MRQKKHKEKWSIGDQKCRKKRPFMRHMVAHLRIIHYGLVQTERLTIRYKNIYQNYEQSQKQTDLAKRQLEHELDQIQKEEEFYFSHGCAKNNTDTFLCPPNTPKFMYEPEPTV